MRPELKVPSWVPPLVAELARKRYDGASASGAEHEAALIARIISDSRMQDVWDELRERTGSGAKTYKLKAIDPAVEISRISGPLPFPKSFSSREDWIQHLALRAIFEEAVLLGTLLSPDAIRASRAAKLKDFESTLQKLQEDAKFISLKWTGRKGVPQLYTKASASFEQAAKNYARIIKQELSFGWPDVAAQLFCVGLVNKIASLFHQRRHLLVANIASIVLKREIDSEQVKEWDRGHWGLKARKRSSRPSE